MLFFSDRFMNESNLIKVLVTIFYNLEIWKLLIRYIYLNKEVD